MNCVCDWTLRGLFVPTRLIAGDLTAWERAGRIGTAPPQNGKTYSSTTNAADDYPAFAGQFELGNDQGDDKAPGSSFGSSADHESDLPKRTWFRARGGNQVKTCRTASRTQWRLTGLGWRVPRRWPFAERVLVPGALVSRWVRCPVALQQISKAPIVPATSACTSARAAGAEADSARIVVSAWIHVSTTGALSAP